MEQGLQDNELESFKEYLINNPHKINEKFSGAEYTLLHQAIKNNHLNIVSLLLRHRR